MPFGVPDYHKHLNTLHINTEAPEVYFIPYASKAMAGEGVREGSEFIKMLSGSWDFKLYESVDLVPDPRVKKINFTEKIPVPSYGDYTPSDGSNLTQYADAAYPFPYNPPFLPDKNPAALYRKTFFLNESASTEKDVFINFDGVESCIYLFVNDNFVGYSEGSHTASKWNVTEYVQKGENEIIALVVKWCSGSYLEDRDKSGTLGIFRDVYLIFRDKERITDFKVKTTFTKEQKVANIYLDVKANATVKISYTLTDREGVIISLGNGVIAENGEIHIAEIKKTRLWSDEDPYLYSLFIECGGEYIKIPVGLRRVEIKDDGVYVNGRKVKLVGAFRHESLPYIENATSMELMLRDVMIMKSHGINAVCTSNYPSDPRFYELCDQYGIYVCDEVEAQSRSEMSDSYKNVPLAEDTAWQDAFLDRAERTFERDKNHPSIIMWSVGDKSVFGINRIVVRDYLTSRDGERIIYTSDGISPDPIFIVDGLVGQNKKINAALIEAKETFRPIDFSFADGKLTARSNRLFTDLSDIILYYTVTTNGKIVDSGSLGELDIKPLGEKTFTLQIKETGFTTLDISARLNRKYDYADIGSEICSKQFVISEKLPSIKRSRGSVSLTENDGFYEIRFSGDTVKISKKTGLIESLTSYGEETLLSPVFPTVWRAPTKNFERFSDVWRKVGFDKLSTLCTLTEKEIHASAVTITASLSMVNSDGEKLISLVIGYRIDEDGVKISARASVKEGLPPLPRFGFRFNLPEEIENLRYFGYGPTEAYEDKLLGSKISLYKTTLTDNFVDYLKPQENGAHCGCRFADVSANNGRGLFFSGESFSLSASHFSPEKLERTPHSCDLIPDKEGTVIVDYRNSGIGSLFCEPKLLPEYTISEREIIFSFYIRPTLTQNPLPFGEYRE